MNSVNVSCGIDWGSNVSDYLLYIVLKTTANKYENSNGKIEIASDPSLQAGIPSEASVVSTMIPFP